MNYVPMYPSNGQTQFNHTQTVYDGINLDQELPGFRTLNVEGREVLSYDMDAGEAPGNRHGVTLRDKKLPARIITIEYEMRGEDKYTFQDRYRLLNDILSGRGMTDVEIHFTDDEGFVYYGQVSGFDSVPAHSNHVFSSFEIYCQDPFKYDRHETILSEADGTLKKDRQGRYEVYYGGTAPNHFVLRNRFSRECGYFQVLNGEDFLAIGDADEADTVRITENTSIVYEQMNDLARWEINTMEPFFTNTEVQGGFEATKFGVKPTMAFSQEYSKVYHGPTAVFEFEEDVLNERIAESFLADFIIHAVREDQGSSESYNVLCGVLDQDNNIMMMAHAQNSYMETNGADIQFYHFNKGKKRTDWVESGVFKSKELNHATFRFRKKGNNVDFEVFDKSGLNWRKSLYLPGFNAAGRYANKVFYQVFRYSDKNFYGDFELRLTHVQKYYNLNSENDIINLFAPNDVLEWDTKSGRRYINGYPFIEGLHLRSDVSMELNPGVNHLHVSKSSWYKGKDNLEIRFRNRYY